MDYTGVIYSVSAELENSVFFKDMKAPLKSIIMEKYNEFATTNIWNNIFKEVNSDSFGESYSVLGDLIGSFEQISEGGVSKLDEKAKEYKKIVENFNYANSFQVTRNAIQDQKIQGALNGLSMLMRNYWLSRNAEGAAFIINAVDGTSTYKGKDMDVKTADGSYLFAKDHKGNVRGVATQSNKYKIGTLASGFTAIDPDYLAKAETAMQNIKDDQGRIAGIHPDTIIIPNDATLKKELFGILGANHVAGSNNNDWNYLVGRYNIVVNQYLNDLVTASRKPFIMLDSSYNNAVDGLIYQNRESLRVRSYIDDKTENIVFDARDRHCFAAIDWREIAVFGLASTDSTAESL